MTIGIGGTDMPKIPNRLATSIGISKFNGLKNMNRSMLENMRSSYSMKNMKMAQRSNGFTSKIYNTHIRQDNY
jgi:hypothetical protein